MARKVMERFRGDKGMIMPDAYSGTFNIFISPFYLFHFYDLVLLQLNFIVDSTWVILSDCYIRYRLAS